jgi:two-component system sensor kinase FixL
MYHAAAMKRHPETGRILATALLVSVAYYLGANVGFILRFPPATPSVLWPPNSILTATLLLSSPRRWWIYLLAAFPAHLAAELGALWPVSLVLLLFATNCSEALLAAFCIRRLSDAPTRFDTLRRVVAFLVGAVFIAPFVSSFLDAGVVTALRDEPYWVVWRIRFFSNVLTAITFVPAIIVLITNAPTWVRGTPLRRKAEAILLATGLVGILVAVFVRPESGAHPIPGVPVPPLTFIVPFILWAALRFGSAGASLSLLTAVLIAIWAATHGRGTFSAPLRAQNALAVQIIAAILAIPLMYLAALMEERRRAEKALGERLAFEELLSRLSGAFVHLPSHEMDDAFRTWLRRLGEFLGLERMALLRLSDDRELLIVSHSWVAQGSDPGPPTIVLRHFPGALEQLFSEQPFIFPPAASSGRERGDHDALDKTGGRSQLTIPLIAAGRIAGVLAFDAFAAEDAWPSEQVHEQVQRLQLVAEVFANALARKETVDALQASEAMKSAILASLSSGVAVVDRQGRVIAVNESWSRLGYETVATTYAGIGMGANYLETCRQRAREGAPHAWEAAAGIEAVLGGSASGFALEYPAFDPTGERWFAMTAVPLNRPEGGAVVSHTDVTERKRAELEVQRSRQELAHFTRVSTMGELSASLAHELSQPLTGILTNAQAAQRFLDVTPPDLAELRMIVSDIISDDKRAGEVIQRLRDLLRKDVPRPVDLDLNALIRDVVRLLSSDAVIREVTITLDLDPRPVTVNGDRVQLQQVVLNLLVNAMEAMAETDGRDRIIVVRTKSTDVEAVHVAVQDAGPGLREGTHDLVFEPFFTTKPAGMGMGLSIVRSIIEAHGGVIWATNNPSGPGATFHFAMPVGAKGSA